tara:strand:- start:143 stop:1405 length:1263 start_codon:yes stop_codon:yes gene_type:complete
MDYKDIFKKQLNQFKSKGYKRTFTSIYRYQDTFPFTKIELPNEEQKKGKINPDTTIWCSNDYLNMSHNPLVIDRMIKVIKEVGTGSGGTRNISGTTPYHDKLEKKLAHFHKREAALIFTSAYVANQTTLATICKKISGIEVFSDQLNHASLIEGIKNSKAPCTIFRHNDLEHLESLLREKDLNQPKIIVFESLYSMDGTETNVSEYVKLAKKYNALTYLDEVHAVGLYGEGGRGVAFKNNVSNQIDIINGTLAKGFGQIGGYIVADQTTVDFVRSFASGFIFTTSMMPSVAAAATKSIEIVEHLDKERLDIFNKAKYFKQKLKILDIPFIDSNSHIIPILTHETSRAKLFSKLLLEQYNSYIQPIFYPTVPEGSARLRITITPKHSIKDIDKLIGSLKRLFDSENSEQAPILKAKQNQVA